MKKFLKIVKYFCKKMNKLCKKSKIWYNTHRRKQMFAVCKTKRKEEGKMMKAPYCAMELARYIIDFCCEEGCPVSNLKLQKMLYFLQVDRYKETKRLLFNEGIYAWPYGPVVPEVYRRYSGYGGRAINNEYDIPNRESYLCLNEKILFLANYDPWDLVDISHKKGGPWDRVYRDGKGEGALIEENLFELEEFNLAV